jgi:hypothetical protein
MARKTRPKSPYTDPQREEVYSWESTLHSVRWNTADKEWFDKTMKALCKRYKVKVPDIRPMPEKWQDAAGVCHYSKGRIHFASGYKSIMVLCHELAHWVMDSYGYGDVGAHGPKWLGVYLFMLNASYVMPLDVLKYSARKAGLKFRDPLKECAPGKLKKYLKKK